MRTSLSGPLRRQTSHSVALESKAAFANQQGGLTDDDVDWMIIGYPEERGFIHGRRSGEFELRHSLIWASSKVLREYWARISKRQAELTAAITMGFLR